MDGSYQSDLECLVKHAMHLAERTVSLCGRLDRLNEFDEEQRAEMYAILRAMQRESNDDIGTLKAMLAGQAREGNGV
jgi:hypothetical protein